MLAYIQDNSLILVLVFAGLALVLVVLRIWLNRGKVQQLQKDPCGVWRYHKETEFRKQAGFGDQLEEKSKKKSSKKSEKFIAVLSFDGDIRAKQHSTFAAQADELVVNKKNLIEVVVRVTSSGGMVAPYGHCYSEMERIRALGVPLTACVDTVAASGGYLMCAPANKIVAAPFAVVGSIGVMAFVPNVRNLLTANQIQPRTFTSGRYKRTVTLFDEANEEEVKHFQGQLDSVHAMFGDVVKKYRCELDSEEVLTGDHWSAKESIERKLGLVDELATSGEYLLERNRAHDLVFIGKKESRFDIGIGKFFSAVADGVERTLCGVGYRF